MRVSIPRNWTETMVQLPVASSDGAREYLVVVTGSDVPGCGCRGSKYHGWCRHRGACRDWLNAVFPPGRLPALVDGRKRFM